MARIHSCVLVAGLLLAAVPAVAADVKSGTYDGALMDVARPVRVELVVDAGKGGSIKFGEPWACGLGLSYAGPRESVQVYSFTGAGAGRCASLSLGYAELKPASGKLEVELFDQQQKRVQKTMLTSQ
ncbi:MAG: hypothetical protein ACM3Q1_10100 [Bacteroidales bacterium]